MIIFLLLTLTAQANDFVTDTQTLPDSEPPAHSAPAPQTLEPQGSEPQSISRSAHPCATLPERAYEMIVPAEPGNSSDAAARLLNQALTENIRKKYGRKISIVAVNNGSAGGILAMASGAHSSDPAKTLIFAQAPSLTVSPFLTTPKARYSNDDLKPVAMMASVPYTLVCSKNNPDTAKIKSIDDFIRYAKTGKLKYGHGGVSNITNIMMQRLLGAAGVSHPDIISVPYRGTNQAFNDVLAGHIDCMFHSTVSVRDYIGRPETSKGVVAVGVTEHESRQINSLTVPAFGKNASTMKFGEMQNWVGVLAPKGMPDSQVRCFNSEINEILKDEKFLAAMKKRGFTPPKGDNTPAEFSDFIRSEVEKNKPNVDLVNRQMADEAGGSR